MATSKERKAAPQKTPAKTAVPASLSHEEIYKLIAETAYYKAKARDFAPGGEIQDWIEAEAEVRIRLDSKQQSRPAR